MGIQELPQNTVRALGANQALTDPASLVKELIDNALDANANSISVEISNNTLDTIQVRDNGHGIAPEDRELVARRYCTSKISRHQDLKDIGGSSLGFRGEALASAAELSGGLVITTRVEGEQVSTALKINQQGEVVGQDRASSSIGTTVKITDFIKANPVRKQVALKNTDACLKKIKRMLQAYAFARPHVRISLKVLKAKNNKGDFVYAPKPNGNAEDAAFKIVGAACSSQCIWSVLEERGFTLQAFLPRPDADLNKVCNTGTFLSVDARPVSTTRGHLKQMMKIYRESLKALHPKHGEIKEPFLFLEISCPQGAYDANIEPAKDDVLFEDADIVVEMVKQLFRTVYEPAPDVPVPVDEPIKKHAAVTQHVDEFADFEMTFGDDLPAAPAVVSRIAEQPRTYNADDLLAGNDNQQRGNDDVIESAPVRRNLRSTMYGCDEEDIDLYQDQPLADSTETDMEELRQARKDRTLSNPWTLAKLNTSNRRPDVTGDMPVVRAISSSPTRREESGHVNLPLGLPTPRASSPTRPAESFHPSEHVPQMRIARDGRMIDDPSPLPPPQRYMPTPMTARPNRDARSPSLFEDMTPSVYDRSSQPIGETMGSGTPLDAIPQAPGRSSRSPIKRQQPRVNKPFVPPMRAEPEREKVWFDNVEPAPRRNGAGRARKSQGHHNTDNLVTQGELGDLIEDGRALTPPRANRDIRDFVGRDPSIDLGNFIEDRNFARDGPTNQTTVSGTHDEESHPPPPIRRDFVPASELAIPESEPDLYKHDPRPPKRRKTADRPALQELSPNTSAPTSIIIDDDEPRPTTTTSTRAPSRRRSSKGTHRSKSSRLPLERTPAGKRVHDLATTITIDTAELASYAGRGYLRHTLPGYEQSAEDGDGGAFRGMDFDFDGLATRLHGLLLNAGSEVDVDDTALVRRDTLRSEIETAFTQYEEQMADLPGSTLPSV
ncbi:unnamed protein product [Zymoseptoria tritici ST99CH_3D7]|uniref:DNA mismatch repair protein S5 domain-containing protein n=1 Tax=Zymoseptoria tritici (strain ST99CH_3D7) TaxID=1276538 RepID=A0A1X7RUH8_ZYMT9|nr:unnamed protein product [Zymoseptoria tritici ST99CH_3D7]